MIGGLLGAGASFIDDTFFGGKAGDFISDAWNDYTGVSAAEESAAATQAAQESAQAFQQQQFEQAQAMAQPWLQGSQTAYQQFINELTGQSSAQSNPLYQNILGGMMESGVDAVNQGAAGSGMLMSGSRLEGLRDVGQQAQSNAYQQYLNTLMQAGSPQTALTLGTAGMGMGQNIAQQLMQSQAQQNQAAMMGQAGQQQAINDILGAGATVITGGLL